MACSLLDVLEMAVCSRFLVGTKSERYQGLLYLMDGWQNIYRLSDCV